PSHDRPNLFDLEHPARRQPSPRTQRIEPEIRNDRFRFQRPVSHDYPPSTNALCQSTVTYVPVKGQCLCRYSHPAVRGCSMPGINLTRDEAQERARLVTVDSYQIDLDLTVSDSTFSSTTMIRFGCSNPGATTFVDLV